MDTIERSAKEFTKFLRPLGYKRRTVHIRAAENVGLYDLNWSGGTRSTYTVFTLDGQLVSDTSRYSQLHPWDNKAEGAKLPLPEGFVVVRTGFFCGKESKATVYVNPANMPKLLAAS